MLIAEEWFSNSVIHFTFNIHKCHKKELSLFLYLCIDVFMSGFMGAHFSQMLILLIIIICLAYQGVRGTTLSKWLHVLLKCLIMFSHLLVVTKIHSSLVFLYCSIQKKSFMKGALIPFSEKRYLKLRSENNVLLFLLWASILITSQWWTEPLNTCTHNEVCMHIYICIYLLIILFKVDFI